MSPPPSELTVASESIIPNARAFVRSLNVLLKFSRLYGLEHTRSANQFESTWGELMAAVGAAGEGGLLLGASGSQLLLDGVPLESTPAERSFADMLTTAGVASIGFSRSATRDEFEHLVRAFMETGPKGAGLSERLDANLGQGGTRGVRLNEIRFVAEDASYSDARMAAQLTVKTLGAEANLIQDWFRSPEKMIQLIAAAEGSHGGSGGAGMGTEPGTGGGASIGTGTGTGIGGSGTGGSGGFGLGGSGGGSGELPPLNEAEMQSLLRLLVQFGEAAHDKSPQLDATSWQRKLSALPQNAQVTLRQALAGVAATKPSAQGDEAMLLRLAAEPATRFAIERYQRGEVKVNAVRQMLDRMGHELETLRKLLKSREDKLVSAGVTVESHADILDRQFWAAVPESGKRHVLMSAEAWCIPPRNVQQYVEELLGRGEAAAAGDLLLHN